MGGMTGERVAACLARPGHRASVAGWSVSRTGSVRRRLDVESRRFLFDDGRRPLRRATPGKAQRYRRVRGTATHGQDAKMAYEAKRLWRRVELMSDKHRHRGPVS